MSMQNGRGKHEDMVNENKRMEQQEKGQYEGTYNHSVRVPQLFKEAAKILRKYENKEGSLKNLIYAGNYKNYGPISGLLHKLVYNQAALKSAIAASNLLLEQPRFDPHLAQVFAAQLISKGPLAGGCVPIIVFKRYEDKIKALVSEMSTDTAAQNKDPLPRYVRVNTLVGSVDCVHSQLETEGFVLEDYDPSLESYDDFLERVKNLSSPYYLMDYHLPELLVFPPGTQLWSSILYKENVIIFQDKASCLPVFISDIQEMSTVLDACAAPGNKTSYMAAKINNKGKIIANEYVHSRFETMRKLLQFRQATCVTCQKMDFFALKPTDYPEVEHVFVDPSCSSSGTRVHNDEVSRYRIAQLAIVQEGLLRHALSFPSVKEVIYSTCSIYEEENEKVVASVLSQYCENFELANLATQLKGWKHFGHHKYSFGGKCLRTKENVDRCTGFFIAKFVRKQASKGIKRKALTSQDSPYKSQVLNGSEELEHENAEMYEVGEDKPKKKKKSKNSKKSEHVMSDSNQTSEALMMENDDNEQYSVEQEMETSSEVKKMKKKRKSVAKVEEVDELKEIESLKQKMETTSEANESSSLKVKKKKMRMLIKTKKWKQAGGLKRT